MKKGCKTILIGALLLIMNVGMFGCVKRVDNLFDKYGLSLWICMGNGYLSETTGCTIDPEFPYNDTTAEVYYKPDLIKLSAVITAPSIGKISTRFKIESKFLLGDYTYGAKKVFHIESGEKYTMEVTVQIKKEKQTKTYEGIVGKGYAEIAY